MSDYEDELICDLAQVYGVHDWRKIPPANAAAMALGLPDDSRVKLKMNGRDFGFDRKLMMMIYDLLNWLTWTKTRQCELGYDPPLPLEETIRQNMEQAEEQRLMGFDDPDELLKYLGHKRR